MKIVTPGTPEFYTTITLALFCLLTMLFLIVRLYKSKHQPLVPYGKIIDTSLIRMVLQDAFDQRRLFEVQIPSDGSNRRPILHCSPDYVGVSTLTLEVNGLKSLSDSWINRPVEVYFRIARGKGEFAHFMFSSYIQSLYSPQKNICMITLPYPVELDNRQKRSFLRITPPEKYLCGAAFWYGTRMPSPENFSDISLWPTPLLYIIKDQISQFSILDMSAGGLRLCFPHNLLQLYDIHLSAVDRFILMLDLLDLLDPETGVVLRLWIHCRTQSLMVDTNDQQIVIGAQFTAWAKPKEDTELSPGTIEWLRLPSSKEVEPIGNWIMRRHIEQFLDRPSLL